MIRIKKKQEKQVRIIDLKLEVIDDVVEQATKCRKLFSDWANTIISERNFCALLMREIDALERNVDKLKERSKNFGELEEKVIAKSFHEVYEELAPKFHYKTQKKSQVPWDSLTVDHQDLMIATVRKVLQRFLVKGEK